MIKRKAYKNEFSNILIALIIGIALTILSLIFDKQLFTAINSQRQHNIIAFLSIITMIGNIEWFIAICFIVMIMLFSKKRRIYPFLAAMISCGVLSIMLKMLILRPRPFEYFGIQSGISTMLSSFPSGHAMLIFALVPFLSVQYPRLNPVFWTLAALVAFSRVYLGVHYISDVIAGAFLGYCLSKIFMLIGEKNGWE